MDESGRRVDELRTAAEQAWGRAIEVNLDLIREFEGIWRDLNALAAGQPDVRALCDRIAADIARLEKVNLAFDTDWLHEAARPPAGGTAQE